MNENKFKEILNKYKPANDSDDKPESKVTVINNHGSVVSIENLENLTINHHPKKERLD